MIGQPIPYPLWMLAPTSLCRIHITGDGIVLVGLLKPWRTVSTESVLMALGELHWGIVVSWNWSSPRCQVLLFRVRCLHRLFQYPPLPITHTYHWHLLPLPHTAGPYPLSYHPLLPMVHPCPRPQGLFPASLVLWAVWLHTTNRVDRSCCQLKDLAVGEGEGEI